MRTIPIILASILVAVPSVALAQSASQMTLLTNKQSYTTGDAISISGTISSLGASNSAVLQVYNPFNVLIQIGTVNIASDGTFHTTVKAEGQSWENDGTYEIKVLSTYQLQYLQQLLQILISRQHKPTPLRHESPPPANAIIFTNTTMNN